MLHACTDQRTSSVVLPEVLSAEFLRQYLFAYFTCRLGQASWQASLRVSPHLCSRAGDASIPKTHGLLFLKNKMASGDKVMPSACDLNTIQSELSL